MPLVRIESSSDPRIADYRSISDRELLVRRGLFIAEGRLVVRRLLEAASARRAPASLAEAKRRRAGSSRVRSLLLSDAALASLADLIDPQQPSPAVYVASKELLSTMVGFNIHRGCLAFAERPAPLPLEALLAQRRGGPLVVLEAVGNPDNIGGIFRNARAFCASGVVLDRCCSDPLYRKAIRVSIGSSLEVPFATVDDWIAALEAIRRAGWRLIGLAPDRAATDLAHALRVEPATRTAFLLGHEGLGLSAEARAHTDIEARIPMAPGVDSLNVATAAAIALYEVQRARAVRG